MKAKTLFGLFIHLLCVLGFGWLLLHAKLSLYLLKMGHGQLNILIHTEKIEDVLREGKLSKPQEEKLRLVERIRRFSVDSLGYKETRNFTTYFDQKDQPLLWVVTACKPFSFKAYEWEFPLIGSVSYKGFFNQKLGLDEYLRLVRAGYDADLSPVSAWSTLGWLPDPVLSSMLKRSKARLANLLFHELFHATYYARSTVEVNENLANFISHKATLIFLRSDTTERKGYLQGISDDSLFNNLIFAGYKKLDRFYRTHAGGDTTIMKREKEKLLVDIYRDVMLAKFHNAKRFRYAARDILVSKNAFFIDARRYDGLYDSLDHVLTKKYKGDLKRMIADLKNR
jgi:predicted aminopeptidase